jgi:hypothetical protein
MRVGRSIYQFPVSHIAVLLLSSLRLVPPLRLGVELDLERHLAPSLPLAR